MLTTKLTQKGQITIPQVYREKLDLNTGSIVMIEMENNKILVEKPKVALSELKGSCKWFTKDIEEEIKNLWGTWKIN